jgi:hypothetical protein
MVATLDDTKRSAIALKLADMKQIQELLIANEQLFLRECRDPEICDRFRKMLEDDQKNMGVVDKQSLKKPSAAWLKRFNN